MLLDSNILIYASKPAGHALREFIRDNETAVSAASVIEVLGYPGLPKAERELLHRMLQAATVLPLSNKIAGTAVALRQARRMSLGDALIAATALRHDLTLVTGNTTDFRWIANLRLIDPMVR